MADGNWQMRSYHGCVALVDATKWLEFLKTGGLGSRGLNSYYGVPGVKLTKAAQEKLTEELLSDLISTGAITLPTGLRRRDLTLHAERFLLSNTLDVLTVDSLVMRINGSSLVSSRVELVCHWPERYLNFDNEMRSDETWELVHLLMVAAEGLTSSAAATGGAAV